MDIRLNYIEKGIGEPLVLLHGNGESLDYFENQIEYFSSWYRVIAIDTRGHGKSPRGNSSFSINQFADDLYEFLNEHNLNNINLLGFSDGGNIALTFALKHPEYINKMIVNGANINTRGVKPKYQIPIEIGYRTSKIASKRNKNLVRKSELLGLMVGQPKINFDELNTLTMPTLVIVGTNDMIKDSHSRAIAKALPNSRFVALKGSHCISLDAPNEYNKVIKEFLEQE